jgi:hypothetical protein
MQRAKDSPHKVFVYGNAKRYRLRGNRVKIMTNINGSIGDINGF